MNLLEPQRVEFTPYFVVAAEGARIGFTTCLACGATITLEEGQTVDMRDVHRDWHAELEHRLARLEKR